MDDEGRSEMSETERESFAPERRDPATPGEGSLGTSGAPADSDVTASHEQSGDTVAINRDSGFGGETPTSETPAAGANDDTRTQSPFGEWSTPGAGGAGGDQPPLGYTASYGPEPSRPRSRGKLTLAALVVAAALVGGVVGGVVVHETSGSTPVQNSLTGSTQGRQAAAPATGNTEAVASSVLPSVVTLNVSLSNGQQYDTGSGIILSSDGLIVTNNHVIEAAANGGSIQVVLNNGATYSAKILGHDQISDLAVIKAQGVNNLKPAALGSSGSLQVGQEVVAIGSPLQLSGTVTSGIVSALDRPVDTTQAQEQEQQQLQQQEQGGGSGQNPFGGLGGLGGSGLGGGGTTQEQPGAQQPTVIDAIQTDAAINEGNSGGALVDMDGRVVGINSAMASTSSGSSSDSSAGSIGIGFAIPIDQAIPVIKDLAAGKPVSRAQLDVTVEDATGSATGAKVMSVTSGGAADSAGIKAGDVITKVNGKAVDDSDGLIASIRAFQPGQKVSVTYVRGGATHTATVTLDSSTSSTGAKS